MTFPAMPPETARLTAELEQARRDCHTLAAALTVTQRRLWERDERHPWRLLALGLADELARLRGELDVDGSAMRRGLSRPDAPPVTLVKQATT